VSPAAPAEPVAPAAPTAPVATAVREPAPPAAETAAPKKTKKPLLIGIIAAAAVVVIAAVVLLLTLGGTKTVDVSPFISVSYDGSNGRGEAEITLDWEGLIAEVASVKKLDASSVQSYRDLRNPPEKWRSVAPVLQGMDLCILEEDGSLYALDGYPYDGPNYEGLSNGESFVVQLYVDEDAAKKQGLRFENCTNTFTVEGLPELPEIDPFEGLVVSFDGMSGDNYLDITYNGPRDDIYSFDFSVDKWFDYVNGEEFTITYTGYDPEFPEWCEFIPTRTEMTYKVEGLADYIRSFDDLTEAGLFALMEAAEEQIQEITGEYYDATYTDPVYCGYVLEVYEEPGFWDNNNLYLFYKSHVTPDDEYYLPYWVYYPVRFSDVTNQDDLMDSVYSYGVDDWFWGYGLDYSDGTDEPYAYIQDLVAYLADGWSMEIGGEMGAYTEGDGMLAHLADISDEDKAVLCQNAVYQAQDQAAYDYGDQSNISFSDFAPIGMYFLSNDEEADNLVIVMVQANARNTAANYEGLIFFAVEYSGVHWTPDGVNVYSYDGLMTNDNNLCGMPSLQGVHDAVTHVSDEYGFRMEVLGEDLLALGS